MSYHKDQKKHGYTKSSPLIVSTSGKNRNAQSSTPLSAQPSMRNVASSASIFSSFINGGTESSENKHKRVRSTGFFPMDVYLNDIPSKNVSNSSSNLYRKQKFSDSKGGWENTVGFTEKKEDNNFLSKEHNNGYDIKCDDLSSLSEEDDHDEVNIKKSKVRRSKLRKRKHSTANNGDDSTYSNRYVSHLSTLSHVTPRARNFSISSMKEKVVQRYGKKPRAEVYGFIGWLTSAAAFLVVLIWAFLPEELLNRFGWTYYPAKYWASAIPSFLCWMWLWYSTWYVAHIHWKLPPVNRYASFCDEYSAILPPGEDSKVVLYDADIHANYVAKSFEALQVAPMRDLGIVSATDLIIDYDNT